MHKGLANRSARQILKLVRRQLEAQYIGETPIAQSPLVQAAPQKLGESRDLQAELKIRELRARPIGIQLGFEILSQQQTREVQQRVDGSHAVVPVKGAAGGHALLAGDVEEPLTLARGKIILIEYAVRLRPRREAQPGRGDEIRERPLELLKTHTYDACGWRATISRAVSSCFRMPSLPSVAKYES